MKRRLYVNICGLFLAVILLSLLPPIIMTPAKAQEEEIHGVWTLLDTSDKEVEVIGEKIGSQQGQPFAGWYTDTVAVDPDTKIIVVAWVRIDADEDKNDYIYLAFLKPIKADDKDDYPKAYQKIIKHVWTAGEVVSLDSLTIGGGRVLLTFTYVNKYGKNAIGAALYDLNGKYIWSGSIMSTKSSNNAWSKSCYVKDPNMFLIVWYTTWKKAIEGRWLKIDEGLGKYFIIDYSTDLFFEKADQMLCIGGSKKALVVYRKWDKNRPVLYAAFIYPEEKVEKLENIYDDSGFEETIGVHGAYTKMGDKGYFFVPIVLIEKTQKTKIQYVVYVIIEEEGGQKYAKEEEEYEEGYHPYAIGLNDRFVLTYITKDYHTIIVANIYKEKSEWKESIGGNDFKYKVYHPIIAFASKDEKHALLVYTANKNTGMDIELAKVRLNADPSSQPCIEEIRTIVSDDGNQKAHGLGVLVYKDKYTYVVAYTDTSDGEEDLLVYVWLPGITYMGEKDIEYYQLPEQKEDLINRLLELINESEAVKIAVSYWSIDGIGKELAYATGDKHEKAYVVIDDDPRNKEVIQYLEKARVNIVTDKGMPSEHIMHDKFVILDGKYGKIVVLLTANFREEDFAQDANVAIIINSESIAYFYEKEFDQLYNEGKGCFGENKEEDWSFIVIARWNKENIVFEGYFSPTKSGMRDKIPQAIYGYITRAKKEICFTSYIFTTSGYVKPIYDALVEKAEKEVHILGVFDEELNTDTPGRRLYWFLDNMTQYENLQIYVDNHTGKMHAKLFVIDQSITIMGSYNPTKSATRIHDEYIIIIREIGEKGVVGSFFNDYIEKNLISRSVLANTLYEPSHLIIRRVLFRGLDDLEWVEIYNPIDQEVDLSNYVIGDADNLLEGDNEGMYKFPSSTILRSKETLIVTTSIKKFYDIYGVDENWRGRIFEFSDSDDISSNDLIPYNKTKFTGEFSLDDNGDEVILARDENGFLIVVDAVWYGDSTYMIGYEGEPESAKPLDISGNGNIVIKEDDIDAVLINEKYTLADLSNNPVQSIISLESNSTLIIYAFDPDKRDSWIEEVKIGSFSITSNNRTVGIDLGTLAEKLGDIGVYDVVITVGEETPIPRYKGLHSYAYADTFVYNETISGDYMYCVSENGGLERIMYESIDVERHEIIVELNNVAGWVNITIPSFWNTSTLRVVVDGSQYDGFIVENGIVAIELEKPASEIILLANTTPNNPVKVDVKLSDNGDKIIVQAMDPDNKYVDVKVTLDKETIQKSGTGSVEVFINSPLEEGGHTLFIEIVEETPSYVEVKHEFTYKVFVEKINKTDYIITLSQAESLSVSYKVVNTTVHKIEILVTTKGEKDWVYVSKPSSWKKIKAIYIDGVDVTNNKELWRIEGNIICVDPSTSNITIIGEIPLGGTAVILNNLVHIEIAAILLTALMILSISGAIVYRRSSKIKLICRKS